MTCTSCNGTGRIVVEIPVFADGGYSDVDQIEADCRCNPEPTDDDAPDWEPMGTAYEDFHPFRANHYEGL